MLKHISGLGKPLNKEELKEINGGLRKKLAISLGDPSNINCTQNPSICPTGETCTYVDIGYWTCQ